MSAPKKTTSKATKSPAPAFKPAKTVAKVKTAPATIQAPAPARDSAPAAVATLPPPRTAAPAAPAPKPVATKPAPTAISARVDVGFGNALFIRGDGPGLSWEKGVAMENSGSDLWHIVLGESAQGFAFKFLVNDATWSTGPDFTVATGTSVTLSPQF